MITTPMAVPLPRLSVLQRAMARFQALGMSGWGGSASRHKLEHLVDEIFVERKGPHYASLAHDRET